MNAAEHTPENAPENAPKRAPENARDKAPENSLENAPEKVPENAPENDWALEQCGMSELSQLTLMQTPRTPFGPSDELMLAPTNSQSFSDSCDAQVDRDPDGLRDRSTWHIGGRTSDGAAPWQLEVESSFIGGVLAFHRI